MEELVTYLLNNPDVFQQVKEGTVSLLGVQPSEYTSIMEEVEGIVSPNYYWR